VRKSARDKNKDGDKKEEEEKKKKNDDESKNTSRGKKKIVLENYIWLHHVRCKKRSNNRGITK
jgi:hypothetical protein